MNSVLITLVVMLIIGGLLGFVLGVAAKAFYVAPDERVEKVTSMLPGYNCGGCGYAGCSGCASAMVAGEVKSVSICKPSKPEGKQAIVDYLTSTPGPDGKTVQITL